eukprot:TRINITY_DN10014_c0_g1_i1.p1 TRINITY_DN10014_c0_g1~~TRINITY_DN10014_c0_g1_i1.p1  ORF type:complete len:320 (+),score=55.10 TRINITY_DN10014_c0_g1_i1:116-1075(+)
MSSTVGCLSPKCTFLVRASQNSLVKSMNTKHKLSENFKFRRVKEKEERSFLLSRRRTAVGVLCWTAVFDKIGCHTNALESRKVRLKDVEDEKIREALRAAVAGDLQKAEIAFSELIQEEPQNASFWSNRGSVRLSLNEFEAAAEDLTKAVKLAPEASVPFLNRAIAYEALGRYQDAVEDCKSAIVNDPEESAAWFNLGNIDVKIQDYEGALAAYERASVLAPGIAGYLLRQALVLFQLNRIDEARKLFESLVRKYPNYAEAHAALAAILWGKGLRSRAEDQLTEALMREPLYKDIGWVQSALQWPPSIAQAMSNLLSIT